MPVFVPTPSAARKTDRKLDVASLALAGVVHIGNKEDIGMPCWYFDKHQLRDTPSIRNGIPYDTERRYRREGARFIMNCGTQMGLGHNTVATGVVYFHRFYMFHSFKNFPRYVTACCCLFLAGKVEETPKKCRDIIRTARALLADNHFYSFGEDPKEEVMTLERILLQTIKFDLQVEHPYTFLLKYAKCFKGDQQKLQKMVQMAWNFVNDSLSTVVCLQWEPEIIAVALIHLASKLSKFQVVDWLGRQPSHARWWDMFVAEVTMDILEDICHQVLDLYQNNQKDTNGPPSPPQLPPSRAELPKPVKPRPPPTNSAALGSSIIISSSSSSNRSNSRSPVRKSAKQNYSMASGGIGVVNSANNASLSAASLAASVPPASSIIGNAITAMHSGGSNNATNHIQPIRSLATSLPASAAQLPQHHVYRPPPPPQAPPPQPIHSIYGAPAPPPPLPPSLAHNYGSASGSGGYSNAAHVTPIQPPPPPPPSYPPNMWPGSTHYPSNVQQPMPPPPAVPPSHAQHSMQQPPAPPTQHGGNSGGGGSGNYYHPHHQQQQHYHSRHQQHYGRQQRY